MIHWNSPSLKLVWWQWSQMGENNTDANISLCTVCLILHIFSFGHIRVTKIVDIGIRLESFIFSTKSYTNRNFFFESNIPKWSQNQRSNKKNPFEHKTLQGTLRFYNCVKLLKNPSNVALWCNWSNCLFVTVFGLMCKSFYN